MVDVLETAAAVVTIIAMWEVTKAAIKLAVKEYRRAKYTL